MKINDIVKRYILQNKKNSFLIIISMIISTALFLVMNIIGEDVRNLMIDQSKKELGAKHASYSEPTNKEIKYIKNNPKIDKVGEQMVLGLHDIGHDQTLQILWDDKIIQDIDNSYTLQKGRFPIEENEIAVDTWYIKQKNIKNPIGKTIKLDYSRPDENGKELYNGEKEFKIIGILNSNPILKAQATSMGVISKECAIKNIPIKDKCAQVMFTLKKEKNIQKQVEKIIADGNLKKSNILLNTPLVKAMSDSISLKIPYIIVNLILALATVLLIYNIFYILVSNRTKDFGILRAVGFVPSDVFKIMMLEVFIYSAISICIGLLLGSIIANLSRAYVIGTIYNIHYINSIKSSSYINVYMISILLSALTIIISVVKPLIISSKIDPMICMKKSDEKININQKSFINKFMTKFFKDYGNIASKNIQRNKKRTNVAIASMVITFFLIATLYTKATSNFLSDGLLKWWIPGDYLMHNIDAYSRVLNIKSYDKQTLTDIKAIDSVTDVNAYRHKVFITKVEEKNLNKNSNYWKENQKNIERQNNEVNKLYRADFETLGIEDTNILNNVLIDGKENLSKLNKEPYIYIDKNASEILNKNKGDKINIDFDIINPETNMYIRTISKEFIIGGIITSLPVNSQAGSSFSAVMSVNQFNKFTGISSYERFDIWTSTLASNQHVENELNKIIEKSGKGILIPYKSESGDIEKKENQKNMVISFVVGVIVILSLFNCCNTIVTSINSRSKEFALFRGIGISKDEIKKIVKLEGLIYIIVSFIISIIPILVVRAIIIKPLENIHLINIEFIGAILIIGIILTTIIMITTSKALKSVQNEDFIEQIKTLQ